MPKRVSQKIKKIRRVNRRQKEEEVQEDNFEKRLVQQVQREYKEAWDFMEPKLKENRGRLKLYNNQRRDKTKVGDPLMFTYHQTILAALYDDKLSVMFGGREEGDEDMAENLNGLSEYDYDEMDKASHDYELDWDALAWGRGLSYFNEFDTDSKTPIPIVWDALTFLRDPEAKSVHGNRLGQGALRFGGREVSLSIDEIKDNPEYFNVNKIKESSGSSFSLVNELRQARSQAQGTQDKGYLQPQQGNVVALQWLTVFGGQKMLVELTNERSNLIRIHEFEDNKWPLIDRTCYPIAHDWDGVSIFDITEDKQRYRAALQNIYGDSARADLYPMYLFDETKIKKSIDKKFGFNKWIPVDGEVGKAATPLAKAQPSNQAQFIMSFLDVAAQKALATPELQQAVVSSKERTLGELNLVASKVDTRYSLAAKLWGISEAKFWRRWYDIYDRDFDGQIHKKVTRLMGSFGPVWRPITRDKIIVSHKLGPDIKIESRILSEARKERTFQSVRVFLDFVAQDQDADLRYFKKKAARLLFDKDEVDRILPPTIDELEAQEENKKLNEETMQRALLEQDHITHLRIHAGAKESPEKDKHINMHRFFLMKKRVEPEVFPQIPGEQPVLLPGMKPEGGTPERPNVKATAPEGV